MWLRRCAILGTVQLLAHVRIRMAGTGVLVSRGAAVRQPSETGSSWSLHRRLGACSCLCTRGCSADGPVLLVPRVVPPVHLPAPAPDLHMSAPVRGSGVMFGLFSFSLKGRKHSFAYMQVHVFSINQRMSLQAGI